MVTRRYFGFLALRTRNITFPTICCQRLVSTLVLSHVRHCLTVYGNGVCSGALLSDDAGNNPVVDSGASILFTVTPTCDQGATPEARFLSYFEGSWVVARDWSTDLTYSHTAGSAGFHKMMVYVRASGNTGNFEAWSVRTFDVQAVASLATPGLLSVRSTAPVVGYHL